MSQDSALRCEVEALGVRLDVLPREEWEAAREEAEGLRALAAALVADLPPPAAPTPAAAAPLVGAVVADAATSGAPASALQLMPAPETRP